jgi:hypothetical protein
MQIAIVAPHQAHELWLNAQDGEPTGLWASVVLYVKHRSGQFYGRQQPSRNSYTPKGKLALRLALLQATADRSCSRRHFRLLVISGLDKLPAVFSTMKQDGFDAITLLSDAQFFHSGGK